MMVDIQLYFHISFHLILLIILLIEQTRRIAHSAAYPAAACATNCLKRLYHITESDYNRIGVNKNYSFVIFIFSSLHKIDTPHACYK